jgi:hypothetical protein
MAVSDVHLSKVQDSAAKAKSLGQISRAFFAACRDFREFHQANQNGEYGSGGSIYDPGNAPREVELAAALDDGEGFILNTGMSRADHAAMVALAFDVADEDNVNHFATEFRRFLTQRVAG